MQIKIFFNSVLLAILFSLLLISPSSAVEGAPEIPAGFGPIVVSGIVLSIATVKSFIEKNLK